MRAKITKRLVDATSADRGALLVWDTEVKGFGLKVTPTGAKTYLVQYRMGGRGSPTRRFTIGTHGSPWTPDLARDEALRLLGAVKGGQDPMEAKSERRAAAERARHAEERRAERTFAAVTALFIERHASTRRSGREMARLLRREVLPSWAERDIAAIDRAAVCALLDGLIDRRAPALANKVLDTVRSLLSFAVHRGVIAANPAMGLPAPAPKVARDRVLNDGELIAVWHAADALGYPFGPLVKLLILTGQRRDEVAGLRWAELSLDDPNGPTWTLPKERAKNGVAHVVHLSPLTFEVLRSVPVTG
jgi:integrase